MVAAMPSMYKGRGELTSKTYYKPIPGEVLQGQARRKFKARSSSLS